MSDRIDSAMAEQILQGDDTDPDILQSLGLDLIAELKRCYELIDAQKEQLEFCWNVIENIDEARWADAVERLVVEHHPSKWCNYTYCPLCDEESASE
jgi:hypothetical protein